MEEPRHRGPLLLAAAVVIAAVGAGVVVVVRSLGDGETTTTVGSSDGVSTTTPGATTLTEPVLIADAPAIYTPVPGPASVTPPSSSGPESALEPIQSVGLDESGFLENLDHLTSSAGSGGEFPDSTLTAVGEVPATDYRIFEARGINGFPNDPDTGQAGECYYLFGIPELPSQASTDCFTSAPAPAVTPLWSGVEALGVYAWADLPAGASVAVLTVDGAAQAWQRPQSGVVAFKLATGTGAVSLVVLDASGVEIARGDRTPRIPPPDGPITGYGDYTGVSPDQVDWAEAWAAVGRCMTEHGYDTIGFDVGLFYLEVPGTEDPVDAVARACLEGMGLPPDIIRADQ